MLNKKTKICATIGPSCQDKDTLVSMVKAGLNIARLNFSHGDYTSHAQLIAQIRAVEAETGEPIAIMQDLQGPKIRVGAMPAEGVAITVGENIVLDSSISSYASGRIPLDYPDLHKFIQTGQRILIDDGHIEVKVKSVEGTKITAEVVEGSCILSHKGLNFPDSDLDISALSEKDKNDLKFGLEQGVDLVAEQSRPVETSAGKIDPHDCHTNITVLDSKMESSLTSPKRHCRTGGRDAGQEQFPQTSQCDVAGTGGARKP